jgi:twinkle protein
MIKEHSIEQVKEVASSNVSEIIGGFISLKKEGVNYKGLCPFHGEKSPSFVVNDVKGLYKCFGCGRSGNAISFLMEHERKTYMEAVKWIAEKYNIEMEQEQSRKSYSKPQPRLEKLEKETIAYFEQKRGISNNTLLRFKVTDSKEWMPKAQAEIPVICFNYYQDNQLVNVKFRGKNKDFKMVKDAKLIFYNLDSIKEEKECTICEGEIDCMALYEAGIHSCVSVPAGAARGKLKLEYLDNCWELFEDKERIVVMTDNDEPGILLRDELARRFGYHRCFKVAYPEDCKDANEVLLKLGKDKLKEIVTNAKEWPLEGVLSVMDDLIEDVCSYWDHGFPKGVELGIPFFDDLLTLMGGQYTTVTGIPGSGKSEFVDFMMAQSTINHDWKWAISSFENPAAIHVTKLMQKFSGRAFGFRRNPEHRMSLQQFEDSVFKVHEYYKFINTKETDITLDGILTKATQMVKRFGIKGLLIDPWNYIEHQVPTGKSETQYVSEALTKIHMFCILNGVHVILVAHPTKLKKENGKYEVPTLYSISGSAHFFNKTDNGLSVYRDFESNIVTVYVQKVRFDWVGKIGFCSFQYNTDTRQYSAIP